MTNGFEQAVRLKLLSLGQHVRYWPKADIQKNAIDAAIGVKALHMSAFDP